MALCMPAFIVVGLIFGRLDVAIAQSNTTQASITNSSDIITTILPSTVDPASAYGHFNVSSCILLDISCSVSVDLHVNKKVQTVTFNLPLDATSSGTCGEDQSAINLAWSVGPANLMITMILDNDIKKWTVASLGFAAKADVGPLVTNGTDKEVTAWQNDTSILKMTAKSGKSFKCDQSQDITLLGESHVTLSIKRMQLQAFDTDAKPVFGDADICFGKAGGNPAQPVDTIVPTAVGCVLAGLVVILIITYFVGRFKRPGYQKM